MLTIKEKQYLLKVLSAVVPSGKNREDVRQGLAILDSITEKVEAMPTEPEEEVRDEPLEKLKPATPAPNHRRK